MEVSVNVGELSRELQLATGSVEKKVTMPMLGNALLQTTADGLMIETTDLMVRYQAFVPATVKTEGAVAINHNLLAKLQNQNKTSDVMIKVNDKHRALISCDRNRTTIPGVSAADFPAASPIEAFQNVFITSEKLHYALTHVAHCTDDDPVKVIYNGAQISVSGSVLTAISTDRKALATAQVEIQPDPELAAFAISFVLPNRGLTELIKLLTPMATVPVEIAMAVSSRMVQFSWENHTFTCQLLEGKYPNCAPVLGQAFTKSALVPGATLREVLGRVGHFSDTLSRAVRLSFSEGGLCVLAATSEAGEAEETLDANYADEELTIKLNQKYLADFLRLAGDNPVKIAFRAAEAATEWSVEGHPGFRYLVMPMIGNAH